MKDLPRVYAGVVKDVHNTQEVFYGGNRGINKGYDHLTIIKKINNIFKDSSHVYKSRVRITFNDHEEEKVIVGRNSTNLITINGELIKIIDILDIERI